MGIRLILGRSGSGKSSMLYDTLIQRSVIEPEKRFYLLVPDQFTMQIQKDIISRHPDKGIMNIEILSFSRLAFRIFGETGADQLSVLDDSGKSLILRKVAGDTKDQLAVIGSNLRKNGYLHEVKSAVSEFMQYGVNTEAIDKMIACSGHRRMLQQKLADLKILMNSFQEYIKDHFITSEETMSKLAELIGKSRLVKDSVFALDEFTGFTPVQWKVICELGKYAQEVTITSVIENPELLLKPADEQNLFYLGLKTVQTLNKICSEEAIKRQEDFWIQESPVKRYASHKYLAHLEENLFRYPAKLMMGQTDEIEMFQTKSPKDEVRFVADEIEKLIRSNNYRYQDIAIVTGDLEGYSHFFRHEFEKLDIPCFIDQTRAILLNPFTECLRGALSVVVADFTYESVFHFLRSGVMDLTQDEIDVLENYILETGIRGSRKWTQVWTRKPYKTICDENLQLENLNLIRQKITDSLEPLMKPLTNVEDIVLALYNLTQRMKIQQKLAGYEEFFMQKGDRNKAKEYAQIYRLVMQLLEQIHGLIGKEEMDLKEFAQILEAGLAEIQVGIIPLNHDRVMIGDIERTRLKEIKILFFAGINDGIIPKRDAKGGLISDVDRDFLEQNQFELAPSPRRQMYIQRLYLYMNMTKPTHRLYLSYSAVAQDGKSLRPGYLIGTIRKMFPDCKVTKMNFEQNAYPIYQMEAGMEYLANNLREYASQRFDNLADLKAVLNAVEETERYENQSEKQGENQSRKLIDAAFYMHTDSKLLEKAARKLYGEVLENSISRLEKFAGCAYSHFLQYGLGLEEREEFSFENTDLGNIYHAVLEGFSSRLVRDNKSWDTITTDEMDKIVDETVDEVAAGYGETILFSTAQRTYLIERIRKVMRRSVLAIKYQLGKGSFLPTHFEVPFSLLGDLPSVTVKLSQQDSMSLKGRIDRVDLAEEEAVYVKVVDYKSGNKDFGPAEFYYGLQLQLLTYLNAAVDMVKATNPGKDVIPAAALYYHIDDPMLLRTEAIASPEEWQNKISSQLKTKGVVNGCNEVVKKLDSQIEKKSDVVPVEYDSSGEISKRSSAYQQEELDAMLKYASKKIAALGREIMTGQVSVNPYETKDTTACAYCPYQAVCKLDPKISGFQKRKLPELSREQVLSEIVERHEDL